MLSRNVLRLIFTTPLFNKIIHRSKRFFNLIRVSTWFIYFVDSKHDRHTSSRCVVDSLNSLRHDIVVGSYNDDSDIGNLSTTSTHSSKRFVTRSIEECDMTTILQSYVVSTNVLCDTTSLTSDNVRFTNVVKQRSFTVVNVTHHSNDWWTWEKIFFAIFLFLNSINNIGRNKLCLETKFIGNDIDSFGIETLVDRNEQTEVETSLNNLSNVDIHHNSQLISGNKLGKFKDF